MTVIIGKGEKTALEVLKEIYGEDVEYRTQIQFKHLMNYDFVDDLSERQQKETVDIVLFSGFNPVCVRVQGGDHTGILKSARDTVQKQMLEWCNCTVVDLWFHDCPELFKEKLNDKSRREVREALNREGLTV
jgi:CO dehydrogenase/acetyl-CoA synthase gamma subunit (corrinoid Fe-S protein)